VAPAGFVFDVSAGFLSRHLSRYEAVLKASALHDWCLKDGWRWVAAAAVFEEVLAEHGVGWFRRFLLVGSVRLWGWIR